MFYPCLRVFLWTKAPAKSLELKSRTYTTYTYCIMHIRCGILIILPRISIYTKCFEYFKQIDGMKYMVWGINIGMFYIFWFQRVSFDYCKTKKGTHTFWNVGWTLLRINITSNKITAIKDCGPYFIAKLSKSTMNIEILNRYSGSK